MDATELHPQDNWHLEKDPKKRKQIQDRLAQRARRKRLAKAKIEDEFQNARLCEKYVGDLDMVGIASPYEACAPPANEISFHAPERAQAGHVNALNHQSKPRPWTSAIMENGKLLGLTCGTVFAKKSNPAGPEIPESLKPTLLQLSTVHWAWIDKFPFPDFRDEIILHSGNINEEEFLEDLFAMEAFTVAPGGSSWDPYAYMISSEFQEKWGYLFPSFSSSAQFSTSLV